jgi:transposase
LAEARLAAHQKNAHRLNATVAFYDESGFMLRPLVRRSWAPRGQTPIIRCWDRRDRLSVIGGILVPPSRARHRLSAVFRIHTRNIKTPEATGFLRALDRHVCGRGGAMIVVQDRLNVHRAAVKRWLAGRSPDDPRVMVEWLPSYAPELNPAEQLWNNGKRVDLANLAPTDRDDLRAHVRRSLTRQRCRPSLLAAAFDHARLPL